MKKIIVGIFALLFCLAGLSAEHLKIKVGGKSIHYNQIRVINKTSYPKYSCSAFLLEESKGKMYVKESLGRFNLDGMGDQDTCTFTTNIRAGSYIGIDIPDNLKEVTYSLRYDEGLFIDTIEVTLVNGTTPVSDGETPLGAEF